MATVNKIVPCLWFDDQAEAAAEHYVSTFKNSGIDQISRYGTEGFEHHRRPAGSVMVVAFHLEGMPFTALNGGPVFHFSEAVSLQVMCDTQDEIDHVWSRLTEGGKPGQCGWLKDRFGLSWQVVPSMISRWMTDPNPARPAAVMRAFLPMQKLDIATIQRAYEQA